MGETLVTLEPMAHVDRCMFKLGHDALTAMRIQHLMDNGEALLYMGEHRGIARLFTLTSSPEPIDVPISMVQVRSSYSVFTLRA